MNRPISDIELAKGIKRIVDILHKYRDRKLTPTSINYYIEEYYPYCTKEQVDRALSMVHLDGQAKNKVRALFRGGNPK